ncbi:MAG: hypothetical protein IKL36_01825 [Clostridia bacterium]|nr:hypothetical protein [Clostridia bacterium]
MSQQPKAKMNIPMCAACVLLCLTLFSIYFTSGLYAKYTARGNGSDDARVAAFDVKVAGNGADGVKVDCETISDTYVITVHNDSEVAVSYSMNVVLQDMDGIVANDAITATFDSDTGTLAPNSEITNTHTLTFTVKDWSAITKTQNGGKIIEADLGFTVTVNVEQID